MFIQWRSNIDPKRLRVNLRGRTASGRIYTPHDLRAAMLELTEEAQLEMASQQVQVDRDDHYAINMTFYVADRRMDYDAPVKHAQDAICAGLGISDSRIEAGNFRRFKAKKGNLPGMWITLSSVPIDCHEDDRCHER